MNRTYIAGSEIRAALYEQRQEIERLQARNEVLERALDAANNHVKHCDDKFYFALEQALAAAQEEP